VLHSLLELRLQTAVLSVLPDADVSSVLVRPCPDVKFGDYQTNALMGLAKTRKMNPRQLAADVIAKLEVADLCETADIAGAGFINFKVRPEVMARITSEALRGEHLFFRPTANPRTIVVDFSSPNIAKPMHVGHIRSTILGDSLARVFRALGHRVVTDNHIGDWGTQFGKLVVGWKECLDEAALASDPIGEMERLYKKINAECDVDEKRLEQARQELVKLQNGDAENLAIWQKMIELSQHQFDTIYGRLGVGFDHALGESFYNSRLKGVVDELVAKGIARESEGAKAIFSDGTLPPKEDPFLIHRDGEWLPNPALIQKTDGAANYATTDLATLAYRWETWQPSEIAYVTDGRQQLHFRQIFAAWSRWQPELAAKTKLAHVWFGSILGDDGKPFKTRSGETVKLSDLLDEAEERALTTVTEKNPDLPEAQRREIARVVGLGSVKYGDLCQNRQSDYVFSWEKMLALTGNTAPYLQYAYTRVCGIRRKAGEVSVPETLSLTEPEEVAVMRQLLNFGLVLEAVGADYRPNYLCAYLYDLAGLLSRFYERCPVLTAEEPLRSSRLALCRISGQVLQNGLNLLGIEVTDVM
jgi:arginyl-tRNA synthetase